MIRVSVSTGITRAGSVAAVPIGKPPRLAESETIAFALDLSRCVACFFQQQRHERRPMKALLSKWHASETCLWCQKERECVTVDFGDGFITKGTLCWGCLQKTVRVKSQTTTKPQPKAAE